MEWRMVLVIVGHLIDGKYSYEETRRDLDPSKFNCGLIKLSCLSLNLIGLISGTCGRAPRPLAFLLNMIILR
ncbi:hypothetical protein EYC80_001120 [Monilinia laxa]|uniref:Uncharacterized protein n=1 Tax=Monilinia laxa TaxID=61186 RepID=A0A5N6K946_MONLA|nr:hypothetical protein EYC80_001120 [Monilinia laxa]